MPKLKSKRTLLKRIKITKNGKFMRKLVGMAHVKETKSVDRKEKKGKITEQTHSGNRRVFKKLLAGHARTR